jgi:hypothetical protein
MPMLMLQGIVVVIVSIDMIAFVNYYWETCIFSLFYYHECRFEKQPLGTLFHD